MLGWLSLFATLALLSPGVIATANADELVSGPSCPAAEEGDEHSVVGLEQMVERLRAEAAEHDGLRRRGDSEHARLQLRDAARALRRPSSLKAASLFLTRGGVRP